MIGQIRRQCAWLAAALLSLLLISIPFSGALAEPGRRGGGHGGGAHHSAPRPPAHASVMRAPTPRAPRGQHVAGAPHHKANVAQNAAPHNNAVNHGNNANLNNALNHNSANHGGMVNHANTSRSKSPTGSISLAARVATIHPPTTYTYGTGSTLRHSRPSGYGRGYRNRYYGNIRSYGRSQGNDRSLVSRLRSVHSTLVRIDHDYQGHRARAAHQISLAIHHLSHRSGGWNNYGNSGRLNMTMAGMNGNQNSNMILGTRRQNGNGIGQRVHLTQAQSDSRLAQALRTTQGVSMQLNHQSLSNNSHRLAQTRLNRAMQEMHLALAAR